MTSEEIKTYVAEIRARYGAKFTPGESPSLDTAIFAAEVAYQLAIANENRDDLTVCICGHPFAHHQEIPKEAVRAESYCKAHPCGCRSFRPIHPAVVAQR